jgi:Skp family chaperone for outer membrane proteins
MAPLYLKVDKVIEEVARENGFDIILTQNVSGFNFLLYYDKQRDISDLVLQKFGVQPAAKK